MTGIFVKQGSPGLPSSPTQKKESKPASVPSSLTSSASAHQVKDENLVGELDEISGCCDNKTEVLFTGNLDGDLSVIGKIGRDEALDDDLGVSPDVEEEPDSTVETGQSYEGRRGYNRANEPVSPFRIYNQPILSFERDLKRLKGLEVKKMPEDGNSLFRAVADQVCGDSELYDSVRQLCIDYMEKERDYFSLMIAEDFASYCKRKRGDKVYGENIELRAISEMYKREIHMYSYSTDPISIIGRSDDNGDAFPILLCLYRGNHYNSILADIDRLVMETSRVEKLQLGDQPPPSEGSNSVRIMLDMGFGYLSVMEAYSIYREDVHSMVTYLTENSKYTSKGKAIKKY